MNVEQPSKIGKIGYLLALMSVFLSVVANPASVQSRV